MAKRKSDPLGQMQKGISADLECVVRKIDLSDTDPELKMQILEIMDGVFSMVSRLARLAKASPLTSPAQDTGSRN